MKNTMKKRNRIVAFVMMMAIMCVMAVPFASITAGASDTATTATYQSYDEQTIQPLADLSTDSLSSLDSIKAFFVNNKPILLSIAGAVAIVCIILAGICFFFGRTGSQIGKGWLLNICIGVAIISAGTFIITLFSGN